MEPADQNAVLDQIGAACRCSLIIVLVSAAQPRNRSVVKLMMIIAMINAASGPAIAERKNLTRFFINYSCSEYVPAARICWFIRKQSALFRADSVTRLNLPMT